MTDLKIDEDNYCGHYKIWPVYKALPHGWKIDKTVGSPLSDHCFATNGRSIINGGKRALVKISKITRPSKEYPEISQHVTKQHTQPTAKDRLLINDLARAKKSKKNC